MLRFLNSFPYFLCTHLILCFQCYGEIESRVECSVCGHSWFQSRDRLMTLNEGLELVPLPEHDLSRIKSNIENDRSPKFTGDAKLYVGNLDFGVTEDDIYELFKTVGEVGEASLITDEMYRNVPLRSLFGNVSEQLLYFFSTAFD